MATQRTSTLLQSVAALLFSILLIVSMLPMQALADDVPTIQPEISGTSGTCKWTVDAAGKLTIEPKEGSTGTLDATEKGAIAPWAQDIDIKLSIKSVVFKPGVIAGEKIESMFEGMYNIQTIDFSGLSTQNVTSMAGMFAGCESLSTITGMNFTTMNVTNMNHMFGGCKNLKSLDLSSFKNTSKVTDMSNMFASCEALTYLDLSMLDTSNVTTMAAMFSDCDSLQTLILKSFNTSKADTMASMFANCTKLKSVQVGNSFSFMGLPGSKNGCKLPDGAWLSSIENTIFSAEQIAETRNNKADTYIKNGTPSSNNSGSSNGSGSSGSNGSNGSSNSGNGSTTSMQVIYRVYNPNSGEHFYTASVAERDHLVKVGWNSEGIGWKAPTHGAEVYRLYNPNVGDHFYTPSAAERDHLVRVGWNYEGISWRSDNNKTVPLYRVYNPNEYAFNHHWTTSKGEFEYLVKVGWKNEGLGWYAAAK